ncbi:hypothetical protein Hypma_001507 [Hypsizygus marmoreus]|uniref:Uncharacterized protein n=1 Tax=Hypsizygus marmoreus TaxID=39966 RepID=A0A369K160_HYPMA|nr:hypothetical protein Hypma_001507 [Hypsizygus marmoreus]
MSHNDLTGVGKRACGSERQKNGLPRVKAGLAIPQMLVNPRVLGNTLQRTKWIFCGSLREMATGCAHVVNLKEALDLEDREASIQNGFLVQQP